MVHYFKMNPGLTESIWDPQGQSSDYTVSPNFELVVDPLGLFALCLSLVKYL